MYEILDNKLLAMLLFGPICDLGNLKVLESTEKQTCQSEEKNVFAGKAIIYVFGDYEVNRYRLWGSKIIFTKCYVSRKRKKKKEEWSDVVQFRLK